MRSRFAPRTPNPTTPEVVVTLLGTAETIEALAITCDGIDIRTERSFRPREAARFALVGSRGATVLDARCVHCHVVQNGTRFMSAWEFVARADSSDRALEDLAAGLAAGTPGPAHAHAPTARP